MATFRDLLSQTKAQIREITPADADARRSAEPDTVFLDVREPDEFEQGAIPGAVFIPRGHLEAQVESRIPHRDTPVVVFCAGGVRSAFATKTLEDLGYTDVVSMSGGFNQWKDQGREWKAPRTLDAAQRNRYRVGMRKVDSARETIEKLNPDVKVITHDTRLDASNVVELLSQYDLVVD